MPAWSVPGSHNVLKPDILFHRIIMSCRVISSAWPICKDPVTFGGGMTMQYAGLSLFDSALKYSFSIQKSYHFFSISLGSYLFSSMLNFISCNSSYIQSKDN